jgi:4-diphosphocytidyl-2-C-methyl-D-erythritol kinase
MDKIVIESQAKINLGLNVIKKRNDGYHDIETIFLPLQLSDILTFIKADTTTFNSTFDELNKMEDNLILKAKSLLEKIKGKEFHINIFVEKNIPIGGGLGGGSSDAAATLKAINKLFNLELDNNALHERALALGSDVPYFLNPVPSYAESRGEILFQMNLEIPYPILIVNPGINIRTSWAFSKIKPTYPENNLRQLIESSSLDFEWMKSFVKNDFEPIVFKEYPRIKEIKEKFYEMDAQFVLMSGTGSSVYGIFTNLQKAYWAEEYFKQNNFTYLNNPFVKGSIT